MAGMNEWMKLSRELIYQQWKLLRAKLFVIGLSCSSIPKFQFSAPVADPVPSSSYSDFSLQSRHVLNAPSSITAQLSIISSSFFLLMTANLRQRISIIYVGCINNPKKSKMMCILPTHCQAQIHSPAIRQCWPYSIGFTDNIIHCWAYLETSENLASLDHGSGNSFGVVFADGLRQCVNRNKTEFMQKVRPIDIFGREQRRL